MFDDELGFMKLQSGDICQFLLLPKGAKFQPIALDGEDVTYTKTDEYDNCISASPFRRFRCNLQSLCKVIDLPIEYELMTYTDAELFAVRQMRFAERLKRSKEVNTDAN